MSVLFAVQSFKGTLNSVDAALIAEDELQGVDVIPVTDGGNGFLDTVSYHKKKGKRIYLNTVNANGSRIQCHILEFSDSIFIESAEIIGKHRMRKYLPILQRSTYGIGIVLNYALKKKKHLYMGLGGSYTADMGFGMLKALGCNVSVYEGTAVLKQTEQCSILSSLSIIPDVGNILEGKKGAIVYAGQKGASSKDMKHLEQYFNRTAMNTHMCKTRYAGAAGGLGVACMIAGADIVDNMTFMDRISGLRKHIDDAHTVITSEGMIDRQSFYGKITGEIIKYALRSEKRIIVIAGRKQIRRKDVEFYTMGQAGLKDPAGAYREILRKVRNDL